MSQEIDDGLIRGLEDTISRLAAKVCFRVVGGVACVCVRAHMSHASVSWREAVCVCVCVCGYTDTARQGPRTPAIGPAGNGRLGGTGAVGAEGRIERRKSLEDMFGAFMDASCARRPLRQQLVVEVVLVCRVCVCVCVCVCVYLCCLRASSCVLFGAELVHVMRDNHSHTADSPCKCFVSSSHVP